MDDGWGDAWAAPATIDAPAATLTAAADGFLEATTGIARPGRPREVGATTPWDDDDDDDDAAWRGANNAGSGLTAVLSGQAWLDDPWASAVSATGGAVDERSGGGLRLDEGVEAAADGRLGAEVWAAQRLVVDADSARVGESDEDPPCRRVSEPVDDEARHVTEPTDDEPRDATTSTDILQPDRKSSKVQGLVDMFDGISKRSDWSAAAATARKKVTAQQVAAPETPTPSDEIQAQTTGAKDPAEPAMDSPEGESTEVQEEGGNGLKAEQETMAAPGNKGPQHVDYTIDMSCLDEIFPCTSGQLPSSGASPDGDLFTAISERKAWYRISRFGSMRRHDQGDGDDYVRVAWAASSVRSRTLELVRRWIGQDPRGGRVPGRRVGIGGGSMFNWDSTAEPVEIAELLRSRGEKRTAEAQWRQAGNEAWAMEPVGRLPAAAAWPSSVGVGVGEDEDGTGGGAMAAGDGDSGDDNDGDDDDEDWGDMVCAPSTDTADADTAEAAAAAPSTEVNWAWSSDEAPKAHLEAASLAARPHKAGDTMTTLVDAAAERELAANIVSRLPDLSYMTR